MAPKKELDVTKFCYVDVHWENNGKRAQKWKRIKIEEIGTFQQENSNFNVFATIQQFKNPVHTSPELAYMPFYFDLDSNNGLVELLDKGRIDFEDPDIPPLTAEEIQHIKNYRDMQISIPNVKTLEKKLKLPVWNGNLNNSREDALKILDFLKKELTLPEEDVRVFFSGKKGFHILVNPVALGVRPSTELHHIFKYTALFLREKLQLETLDYKSIYSSRRMLRLPNSLHQGSRLFKVELSHEELTIPIRQLTELASQPRESIEEHQSQENDVAREWYENLINGYNASERAKNVKIEIKDDVLVSMKDYPVCVRDILDNGIKKSGDRNAATMALTSYFKDIGTPMNQTENILVDWAMKIPDDMTSAEGNTRKASTITAIRTIYNSDMYHFGCPFIRSLHGERRGMKYDPVPCAGRICPLHDDHRIETEPAQKLHLSETAKSEYTGKKVSFDCLVSGKLDTPYIVPKKVSYICNHVDGCTKECVMHDFAGFFEKEFSENERVLIEATHQNDNNLKGILRFYSRASCNKVGVTVDEYINIEELLVVPMAERVFAKGDVEIDETGKEYVSRKVYYVGNRIQTNQHYEFEGFVYPHPKNQFGTILSQKCVPKQDSVASFEVTDEIKEQFKVFQVAKKESVVDRMDFLLDDLTKNVTRIWQREEALMALLLTYHSVLTFKFQEENQPRGWMEMCLIGDSGQAKTHLVEKISDFIGLGERASGESSSRTGLIYRLEQMGERWFITWGKYPLNDRKMLIIDELTGLAEEDLSKMTEPRSTGVLRVDRIVNAETNARTRLVFMTNPRYGKQLFEFTYGIESLKTVFPEASDIRRLDLAVFMATKDVPKSVLNQKYSPPEEQHVTSEALKNSVLWAWSRRSDDIVITEPALDTVLEISGYLGDKYGSAEDIPLVSPADQRIKLARIAIAVACMVHSTDANHQKVIVKPEHVEFVRDYLETVFDAQNCRYDVYAMNAEDEGNLIAEEADDMRNMLDKMDTEDSVPASREILELFRRNDALKSQEILDMSGYDKLVVNARVSLLAKHNFLRKTRNGFKKLPKFIAFLDVY